MERNDVAALRTMFPERYWGWLDGYLVGDSGWRLVEHFAGTHRAVVAARALGPIRARLVIEGERGQGFVTVAFGEDGAVCGFALYPEEYEGIGTVVLSCPREQRREAVAFYGQLLGVDPQRLPGIGFGGREYNPDAPRQMHLDLLTSDVDAASHFVVGTAPDFCRMALTTGHSPIPSATRSVCIQTRRPRVGPERTRPHLSGES